MQHPFTSKGASIPVAPFAFWLLLVFTYSLCNTAAACPARETGERVTVVYVYDGDTVKLSDGRRVRLIGINTPELRHNEPGGQPFATEARAALQSILDRGNRTLLLQYGKEHKDHYGRLLAHAFLENGDNIARHLLQAGLATTLVIPPNTWAQDCYQRLENQARIDRRGIWGHPRYQLQDSRSLPASTRGFSLILGKVEQVRHAGGNTWLELQGPLTVRIDKRDIINFPAGQLDKLTGQTVEVRGWVRSQPSGLVMTVKHPAALIAITKHAP